MTTCNACGNESFISVDFDPFLVPTSSFNKAFRDYQSLICENCGVIIGDPDVDEKSLADFYNGDYRKNEGTLHIGDCVIDMPFKFPQAEISLARGKSFCELYDGNRSTFENHLNESSIVVDYGGFQGFFLNTLKQVYGVDGVVYDYNSKGLGVAERLFKLRTKQAHDIYSDEFEQKADAITLVHVFEHLKNPKAFLDHIKEKVLKPGGLLYIEVPNAYFMPLSDPTHFCMYIPDSLTNLLKNSEFEVIDCKTTGYPNNQSKYSSFSLISNAQQNIVCLARHNPKHTQESVKIDSRAILDVIKRNYARLSRTAAKRKTIQAIQGTVMAAYYWAIVALDFVSGGRSNPIVTKIKRAVSRSAK